MAVYENEGYVPSGPEKGHPPWDIGIVLTRHNQALFDGVPCARVAELRESQREIPRPSPEKRLRRALALDCT